MPAPYLFLSRTITPVQAAFGPIGAGSATLEAVRRLNDFFQLRDCPQPQEMIFPDQPELFDGVPDPGCLRMEIGTCLGPCTGHCQRRDYQAQAGKARDFLVGRDLAPLADLQARDAGRRRRRAIRTGRFIARSLAACNGWPTGWPAFARPKRKCRSSTPSPAGMVRPPGI